MEAVKHFTGRFGGGQLFDNIMEAEQMTLGGILLHPERLTRVKAVLKPDNFHYEKHRMIYRTMLDMAKQSIPIDVVTLYEALEERGQLDRVGRASYLTYLTEIPRRGREL